MATRRSSTNEPLMRRAVYKDERINKSLLPARRMATSGSGGGREAKQHAEPPTTHRRPAAAAPGC